jgi:hypothetical protein
MLTGGFLYSKGDGVIEMRINPWRKTIFLLLSLALTGCSKQIVHMGTHSTVDSDCYATIEGDFSIFPFLLVNVFFASNLIGIDGEHVTEHNLENSSSGMGTYVSEVSCGQHSVLIYAQRDVQALVPAAARHCFIGAVEAEFSEGHTYLVGVKDSLSEQPTVIITDKESGLEVGNGVPKVLYGSECANTKPFLTLFKSHYKQGSPYSFE